MLVPRIERLDVVPSTNTLALERAARGEVEHGTLFLARGQTAGRGTRGRRWIGPPGEGVYASLVLVPDTPPPSPAAMSIAAGLAVREASRAFGLAARLKWPNDVLVGDAKLAGLLVERRGNGPYVVGIGWNVTTTAFPAELEAERAVTSLAREGADVDLAAAEVALVAELARWCPAAWERPDVLLDAYLRAAELPLGGKVRARGPGDAELEGRLVAFGFRQGATLELDDGARRSVPLEHLSALAPRA